MQMNCFQLQMPLPLAFLIIHFVLSSSNSVECRSDKLDVASSSFFVLSFSLRIGWNQFCLQLFCHFCASKNCRCRSRDAAWSVSYSAAFGEVALRQAVFALQVELHCISTFVCWNVGSRQFQCTPWPIGGNSSCLKRVLFRRTTRFLFHSVHFDRFLSTRPDYLIKYEHAWTQFFSRDQQVCQSDLGCHELFVSGQWAFWVGA